VRIVQGGQVQLGAIAVAMSVSWIALVVNAALAVCGAARPAVKAKPSGVIKTPSPLYAAIPFFNDAEIGDVCI